MEKEKLSIFPIGNTNDAFAQYFVGQSYLNMLSTEQVVIGNVTFEPGCHNMLSEIILQNLDGWEEEYEQIREDDGMQPKIQ